MNIFSKVLLKDDMAAAYKNVVLRLKEKISTFLHLLVGTDIGVKQY